MDITYTWDIVSLKKGVGNGVENVVVGVNWSLSGECGEDCSGIIYGYTDLPEPGENFIPWELITKENIITWLLQVISPESKAAFELQVKSQIIEQQQSVIEVTDLPWSE